MHLEDLHVSIPLSALFAIDDLEAWETPETLNLWRQVNLGIHFDVACASEQRLAPKDFTLQVVFEHEAARVVEQSEGVRLIHKPDLQRDNAPQAGVYYLGLSPDMLQTVSETSDNILDFEHFYTHGYIPVCDTEKKALCALDAAYRKRIQNPVLLEVKIFNGANVYLKQDRYDTGKFKLFFPIATCSGVTTEQLTQRYNMKYKAGNVKRWELDYCKMNFSCIEVRSLWS